MAKFINEFLFGFYPYLCMVVYFLGSWARFDRSQYTWRSQSSQLLRLFFGHFFGLLTPPEVYKAFGLTVKGKQMMAVVAGGIFAFICFIGMTLLIHRRLFDVRIRKTSKKTDIFILLFLYVQLIIGMAGIPYSVADPSGGHMLVMAEWSRSILLFQPGAAHLLDPVPWIYKIHIVFGMTLFLLTPFTRLVHIFSAPIWYLGRPGYQIVRRNRGAV
jgi:nitrate reductase gamma subunit